MDIVMKGLFVMELLSPDAMYQLFCHILITKSASI